jgi:hypothetical protein
LFFLSLGATGVQAVTLNFSCNTSAAQHIRAFFKSCPLPMLAAKALAVAGPMPRNGIKCCACRSSLACQLNLTLALRDAILNVAECVHQVADDTAAAARQLFRRFVYTLVKRLERLG